MMKSENTILENHGGLRASSILLMVNKSNNLKQFDQWAINITVYKMVIFSNEGHFFPMKHYTFCKTNYKKLYLCIITTKSY